MFNVGFSELAVIAVVALVVIGPERLPGVARTAGALFGRMRRYVNEVKAEVEREMDLGEFEKIRATFHDAAREARGEADVVADALREDRSTVASSLTPPRQ
jgi:sec-independent protein translocase protein TatB